jgi:hypothetical protein
MFHREGCCDSGCDSCCGAPAAAPAKAEPIGPPKEQPKKMPSGDKKVTEILTPVPVAPVSRVILEQ